MATDNLPLNLRRLLFFHHASGREAAGVIGASEHSVSAWLTGKWEPNSQMLLRMADLYDFDPRDLAGDTLHFAQELADPERIEAAETNIRVAAAGSKLTGKEKQLLAATRKSKVTKISQAKSRKGG